MAQVISGIAQATGSISEVISGLAHVTRSKVDYFKAHELLPSELILYFHLELDWATQHLTLATSFVTWAMP